MNKHQVQILKSKIQLQRKKVSHHEYVLKCLIDQLDEDRQSKAFKIYKAAPINPEDYEVPIISTATPQRAIISSQFPMKVDSYPVKSTMERKCGINVQQMFDSYKDPNDALNIKTGSVCDFNLTQFNKENDEWLANEKKEWQAREEKQSLNDLKKVAMEKLASDFPEIVITSKSGMRHVTFEKESSDDSSEEFSSIHDGSNACENCEDCK